MNPNILQVQYCSDIHIQMYIYGWLVGWLVVVFETLEALFLRSTCARFVPNIWFKSQDLAQDAWCKRGTLSLT